MKIGDRHCHDDSTHEADKFGLILEKLREIMINTTSILKAVADERTELKSWEALSAAQTTTMTKLAADLATAIANSDPAATAQVQADLEKAATDLSADNAEAQLAIAANTPAAPVVP